MTSDITTALYRFELGLPARYVDVIAIGEALPEFLERGWVPESAHTPSAVLHVPLASRALWMGLDEWVEALRRWTSACEPKLPERVRQLVVACPLRQPDCPLYGDVGTAAEPSESPSEPHEEDPDATCDDAERLRPCAAFLSLGGGPAGAAGNSFLDLLRKSTKGCKGADVRQLIVTDPYLHTSFDETGAEGDGFTWFNRVLEDGLAIDREHSFELFLNPALGEKALDLLRHRIRAGYPKAAIKPFTVQRGKVHDRFYLVRGASDELKGVFGPSLNGLCGSGVFLMGELDGKVLKRLNDIVRCA